MRATVKVALGEKPDRTVSAGRGSMPIGVGFAVVVMTSGNAMPILSLAVRDA